MRKQRENNYDLLRIVSCVAVIVIHAAGPYFHAYTDPDYFGVLYKEHFVSTSLVYCLSCFAVPCFMMLSGAFALSDERNADWSYFYRKQFRKFGVPTIVFTVLYSLLNIAKALVLMRMKGQGIEKLLTTLVEILCGQPFYHMWYLYAVIGIYLLVPFILRFKRDIGEEAFRKFAWIFLLLASLGGVTSTNAIVWDVGAQFRLSAFFMVGYELRCITREKKNNLRGSLLICAGGGMGVLITIGHITLARMGVIDDISISILRGNLSPWYVVMSILIFAGFSYCEIHLDFSRLANDTFYVYLFHAGVLNVLSVILRFTCGPGDSRIRIFTYTVLVFLISLTMTRMVKSFIAKSKHPVAL